ncbi:MAG: T9SS type A sorting domain-containing protein [Ignavibacteriaceae bacterium]|nr:T9SS type A sorting domain-containing protein [Ignavibacteriaceae bacterium]
MAPTGGVVMRGGGLTDVPVTGLIPGPAVVHFVYDSSVPEVRTYVNGVFQSAVGQTAPDLTSTSDIFKVGSRGTSTNMAAGELMDEFRFYDRALDAAEVAATWNITIIPVELTSFTASVNDNDVTLNWVTASEINNSGFQVERKSIGEYEAIGFVPGYGTTTETKAYSFSDANLTAGTYSYRLKQIDYDGTFEYSDPVEVEIVIPDVYSLHQNYPNPFNPTTNIIFTLATNAKVTLKVFDILGQEVLTLVNKDLTAGVHTYNFDAVGFNSGVYFYRIEANGIDGTNFTNVKKMILLK